MIPRRRLGALVAFCAVVCLGAAHPSPSPSPPSFTLLPTPEPDASGAVSADSQLTRPSGPTASPDAVAERFYRFARDAWRERKDVPFVHYGSLIRYEHNNHVFDNWWDAYFRPADGSLGLNRLVDVDEDRRRLRGVPFSIFGVTIFDTNRDSEPIHLDDPRIDPTFSFGLAPGIAPVTQGGLAPEITPAPGSERSELRQIAVVASNSRSYDVRYVGTSRIGSIDAIHLTFTPLRDPKIDRLRELWLDPTTYRTMELRVQGILSGKPYDGVSWLAHYVVLDGRNYLQQIVADAPLHFGTNVTVPKLEFDFFDYRFPATVPAYTFGGKIF